MRLRHAHQSDIVEIHLLSAFALTQDSGGRYGSTSPFSHRYCKSDANYSRLGVQHLDQVM
jgi:hypothetical protein